jgi:MFS family permease
MPAFSGGRRAPARPVRPSLHDPRFALLLAGQSAGWVCSWAASIVLWGFAAYHFGAGPAAISLTALCWSGPPVLLTAFTGGLTDRFGPRRMLIIGYTCSAATSVGMAASGSLLYLDLAALACGAARSLCSPASSALPARVVAPDDLLAANALLGVTASIGQVAGPLAASVLMAASGFRVAFVADAAMYLLNALALLPLPVLEQPDSHTPDPTPHKRTWLRTVTTAAAGAAEVTRVPALRAIALARMGVIFTAGAYLVIEPLYAQHVLGRASSQFALFQAATGIGAIATGLMIPLVRRRMPKTAISCGLAAALLTGTPWIPVAYLGALLWGVCGTVFYAAATTTLQRLAPPGRLGRVAGVISAAESTTESISMPIAGALVAVAGLQPSALILAAVAVAAGATCLRPWA